MTITEFIKADLKTRIASGGEMPGKLTLTALSEHYAVSPTPVRQAVAELIEERYLEKRPNGRLTFDERWQTTGESAQKKSRTSTATVIVTAAHDDSITAEIIRRSLLGEAGFLREEAAAEEFGVGRSVIRRVFSTLAGRGLIEHVPRRGWRIRAYREADMLQYLDVRESLELKALDLAWDQLVPDRIQAFLAGNSAAAAADQKIDNRLHYYWIECCGNRYIIDFFAQHGGYFGALFDQAAMTPRVIRQAASEHRDILQAILSEDKRLAKRHLAQHIRGQRPKVSRMYEAMQEG